MGEEWKEVAIAAQVIVIYWREEVDEARKRLPREEVPREEVPVVETSGEKPAKFVARI